MKCDKHSLYIRFLKGRRWIFLQSIVLCTKFYFDEYQHLLDLFYGIKLYFANFNMKYISTLCSGYPQWHLLKDSGEIKDASLKNPFLVKRHKKSSHVVKSGDLAGQDPLWAIWNGY